MKIRTEDKHKIDEKLSDNTIQEENVMNDATQQRDSCKYRFFIDLFDNLAAPLRCEYVLQSLC